MIDRPYVSPAASFENRIATATSRRNGSIAGVFVFVLLGLFAVMSTLMVLLGAQLYRSTVSQSTRAAENRVLSSYVRTMVRGMDGQGQLRVDYPTLPDGSQTLPVLTLQEEYDGEYYVTQLYLWEGSLRELFTEAAYDFDPEDGERITPATLFEPRLEDGLLTVALGNDSTQTEVRIALRTPQP